VECEEGFSPFPSRKSKAGNWLPSPFLMNNPNSVRYFYYPKPKPIRCHSCCFEEDLYHKDPITSWVVHPSTTTRRPLNSWVVQFSTFPTTKRPIYTTTRRPNWYETTTRRPWIHQPDHTWIVTQETTTRRPLRPPSINEIEIIDARKTSLV